MCLEGLVEVTDTGQRVCAGHQDPEACVLLLLHIICEIYRVTGDCYILNSETNLNVTTM